MWFRNKLYFYSLWELDEFQGAASHNFLFVVVVSFSLKQPPTFSFFLSFGTSDWTRWINLAQGCTTEIYRSCVNTGHLLPFTNLKPLGLIQELLLVSSSWLRSSLKLRDLITLPLGKYLFYVRKLIFNKLLISLISVPTFIAVKLQQIERQPDRSWEE